MHPKYGVHLLINELENKIKKKDEEINFFKLEINKLKEEHEKYMLYLNNETKLLLDNISEIVINSNNIKIENINLKNKIQNMKIIYEKNIIDYKKECLEIIEKECNKRIGNIIKYNYLIPKNNYLQ